MQQVYYHEIMLNDKNEYVPDTTMRFENYKKFKNEDLLKLTSQNVEIIKAHPIYRNLY